MWERIVWTVIAVMIALWLFSVWIFFFDPELRLLRGWVGQIARAVDAILR
jgi:hypothetical protein